MTDEILLRLALHGGESEWEELHRLCLDRKIAERLAQALERRSTDADDVASAWASVLEELHAGLKIKLAAHADAAAPKRRPLRILCAEDNEQICELLKKVLSEAGHSVECVLDGQLAWNRLSLDPLAFDILITDYQMPDLNGLELVQRLRATAFAGRIIVESGHLTPEIEGAFRALRVDRIVSKTTHPNLIRELIAELN